MIEYESDPLLWIISALGLAVAVVSLAICFMLWRKSKLETWFFKNELLKLVNDVEGMRPARVNEDRSDYFVATTDTLKSK